MYERFFELRKKPFSLTADPSFLLLMPAHREALTALTYAVLAQKGFVVLTGPPGTGKTTLISRLISHATAAQIQSSVILNPLLTANEFLELMLLDFGVTDFGASKAQKIWALQNFLIKVNASGNVAALFIDEAHKLSPEVLEEVRLLGNFDNGTHKLLQIVLSGQPELDTTLARADLWQLKQRVAYRAALVPCSPGEVREYIAHRWATAGGKWFPFDGAAVQAIVQYSQGIPRLINSICDNALMNAFADSVRVASVEHVLLACRDLALAAPQPQSTVVSTVPVPEFKPVVSPQLVRNAGTAPSAADAAQENNKQQVFTRSESSNSSRFTRWVEKLSWR